MRWIAAAAWPASMAWPLSGAPGSGPMAEQRESKLVDEVLRGLKSQNQENPTEFRRHRLPLPVWPPGSCAWQLQSPGEFIAGLGASGDGVLRIISTFHHLSGWSYIFCCMAQNARKSAAGTQPVGFVGLFSEGLMWGGSGVHCRAVEVRLAS